MLRWLQIATHRRYIYTQVHIPHRVEWSATSGMYTPVHLVELQALSRVAMIDIAS